jgi:hypothetical protein
VSALLHVTSSNPTVVGVPATDTSLAPDVPIQLRGLTPGTSEVRVEAPANVVNRVPPVDVTVDPFEFYPGNSGQASRYLVTKLMLTNPRPQPTVVTLSSIGATPLRLGTSPSGGGAPSVATMTMTLAASESRAFYVEPAGTGSNGVIQLSAADFKPATFLVYTSDPQLALFPAGPLTVNLSSGTVPLGVLLADGSGRTDSPLGQSYGPLKLQLQSSNPQIVSVPSGTLDFAAGDSRKDATLQLSGRGDAVISVTAPAGFAGSGGLRRDIVITVK